MNNFLKQKINKEYLKVFLISILLMSIISLYIKTVANLDDYYFNSIKGIIFDLLGTFLYYFIFIETLLMFTIFFFIITSLLQNSYLVKIQSKEEFTGEIGENKEIFKYYKYIFSYVDTDNNNELKGKDYLFSGNSSFNVDEYKIIFKVSEFSKSFILKELKVPDTFLTTGNIFNDIVINYLIKINASLLLRYIIFITLLLSPHIIERFI